MSNGIRKDAVTGSALVCRALNRLFWKCPIPERMRGPDETNDWAEYWLGELQDGPAGYEIKGITWDRESREFRVYHNDQLGAVDERTAFLREGKTEILLPILAELVTPADLGCSLNFFLLAMDKRFRTTQPEELFDLIAAVLRERIPRAPNAPDETPRGTSHE